MKRRTKKRIFLALAIAGFVIAGIMAVNDGVQERRQNTPATPLDTGSPVQPSTPATSSEPAGQPEDAKRKQQGSSKQSQHSRQDALNAAAEAHVYLSKSQFERASDRKESVRKLAVPEERAKLARDFGESGRFFADFWGYGTSQDGLSDLLANGYDIDVEMTRVESFGNGQATISLYVLEHWVTKEIVKDINQNDVVQQSHLWPYGIDVVKMRWHKGRWLYVTRKDPAPGSEPVFTNQEPKMDPTEIAARYQPYLKEYEPYVLSDDG